VSHARRSETPPARSTYAEALAGLEQTLARATASLNTAAARLKRVRRHGRDPKAALLAWNLARNEVEHWAGYVAWLRRLIADRPELAGEPMVSRGLATAPGPGTTDAHRDRPAPPSPLRPDVQFEPRRAAR